jgi:hypothetical protein
MYPDTWDSMARAVDKDVVRSHDHVLLLHTMKLSNIHNLDSKLLVPELDLWNYYEEVSPRECHMSRQQNIELAGYIKDYFDNGFDIHKAIENPEDKFTTSKSLQEAGLKRK